MSDTDSTKPKLTLSEEATTQKYRVTNKVTREAIFPKNIASKITNDEDDSKKRGKDVDSIFRKRIDTKVTNEEDDSAKHGTKNKKRADGRDEEDDKPKAKKPRVSSELLERVTEKIKRKLFEKFCMKIKTVTMEALARAIGFQNPRSAAIVAAMQLLKEQDIAEKNKKGWSLTEKGIRELAMEDD